MMRPMRAILLALLLVVAATLAVGQDARAYVDESVSVRTAGGARFQGRVLAVLDDRMELVLPEGRIVQLALDEVVEITRIDTARGERALFEDSAANRLVVMPTGFPLERGEFHVASQEIIAVTGSYGINDWLSVWAGVSLPGALFSLRASFMPTPSMGVSAGSFVGASWFDLSLGPLVLPYALVSVGDSGNNFTVGSGFAMTFSDGFQIPGWVVAIAGKRTLTSTTALVTENWVIWTERAVGFPVEEFYSPVPSIIAPSVVFRIASDRLSWDLGAVVPFFIEADSRTSFFLTDPVFPIPIFSVTYRVR